MIIRQTTSHICVFMCMKNWSKLLRKEFGSKKKKSLSKRTTYTDWLDVIDDDDNDYRSLFIKLPEEQNCFFCFTSSMVCFHLFFFCCCIWPFENVAWRARMEKLFFFVLCIYYHLTWWYTIHTQTKKNHLIHDN